MKDTGTRKRYRNRYYQAVRILRSCAQTLREANSTFAAEYLEGYAAAVEKSHKNMKDMRERER